MINEQETHSMGSRETSVGWVGGLVFFMLEKAESLCPLPRDPVHPLLWFHEHPGVGVQLLPLCALWHRRSRRADQLHRLDRANSGRTSGQVLQAPAVRLLRRKAGESDQNLIEFSLTKEDHLG